MVQQICHNLSYEVILLHDPRSSYLQYPTRLGYGLGLGIGYQLSTINCALETFACTLMQKITTNVPLPSPLVCASRVRLYWIRTGYRLWGPAHVRYQHSGSRKEIYWLKNQVFQLKEQGIWRKKLGFWRKLYCKWNVPVILAASNKYYSYTTLELIGSNIQKIT